MAKGMGSNIVDRYDIPSFEQFLKVMAGFQQLINAERRDAAYPLFLFRGMDREADLKASIEKFREPQWSIHVGREMFRTFKERCAFSDKYSDWDILSFARHFALPTRMLDWSSNSLVALWFAIHTIDNDKSVIKSDSESSIVWVLRTEMSDFREIDLNEEPFPIAHGKTVIFKPTDMEMRIKNQDSFMMRQVYEYKDPLSGRSCRPEDMEIKSVVENPIYRGHLWEIHVQRKAFVEIDDELQRLGIRKEFLFPKSEVFDFSKIKSLVEEIKEKYEREMKK